jgi:hypothetical protein
MPHRSGHWALSLPSNRRNKIARRPVSRIWRREDRRCFKRRRKKIRLRQMKREKGQGKTQSAGRRSVRSTQVNVRLSGQIRRLVSRHLHKYNANPRFVIARRRGQCKEKKGDSRGAENQAAVKGEKGRTCNPNHKARPDCKFEDNYHDEAAIYHIVEAIYEYQTSSNR